MIGYSICLRRRIFPAIIFLNEQGVIDLINKIFKRFSLLEGIKDYLRFSVYLRLRRLYGNILDCLYRIDTEEIISLDSLGISEGGGERCESTPIGEFSKIMRSLPITPNDVFLDLGCGKGRTLLLAGKFPFKKIVGLDISRELTRIANNNIISMKKKLKCQEYELITANALDYEVPLPVTHIYLFNPFPYLVLAQVLKNLKRSLKENPRDITFIYYNPKYSTEIERDFQPIKVRNFEFGHFSLYRSSCNVYRFTNGSK
jgi:SAM-dependent methyltransferase